MNLIALVDKKWGIANKGRELMEKLLLWEERH